MAEVLAHEIRRLIRAGQLRLALYANFRRRVIAIVGSRAPATLQSHHCRATMPDEPNGHARRLITDNICYLLYSLKSSTYDEIAPKAEHWIEFVLTEPFTTIDDLV